MAILSKNKILKLAKDRNVNLLGENYDENNIEGASYDFRIGTIFKDKEIISTENSNVKIVEVIPSQIVTILTIEEVRLPLDICGTVFAVNKKSSTGLLILNPGHIDPGYEGPVSICAINLSNNIIRLSIGEKIFSIVFSELEEKTTQFNRNWNLSRKEYEIKFFKERASKLSPSFFDLIIINEYREYLREQIGKVLNRILLKYLKSFVAFLIAVITIIGGYIAIRSYTDEKQKQLRIELEEKSDSIQVLNDSLHLYRLELKKQIPAPDGGN